MQRLTQNLSRPRRRGSGPADDTARSELRLGLAAALVLVLVLATAGIVHVLPIGKTTYTAELAEAGSVKVGDSVRVAGIPVGSVRSLELLDDRVRMRFTVDREVFLGDKTALDIRMLTAAGGHYVAVQPAGTAPLGRATIPPERITLPYSLMQTFRDAAAPIGGIDPNALRENFTALQNALTTTPDGIRRMGQALDSIVGILNAQNADISQTLTVADEYAGMLDSTKSRIGQLLHAIQQTQNVLFGKRTEIKQALTLSIDLTSRVAALEPSWRTTLQPMTDTLAQAMPQLQELGTRFDSVLATLGDMGQKLQNLISPEGTVTIDRSTATLSPVCIPLPGQGC